MRSLVSLDEAGYVVRLSDGRYALGAKTFQLGTTYRANFNLEQHVLPVLQRLSQETLESSAFHVRDAIAGSVCFGWIRRSSCATSRGPQISRHSI